MSAPASSETRQRILEGARDALALHGIAKIAMADIAEAAGVSRATLYRYFPSLDALLGELTSLEADEFRRRVLDLAHQAPTRRQRLQVVVDYATRHVQQHPVLQRLVRSDPGRALDGIRQQYPSIRKQLGELLGPLLEDSPAVTRGHVAAEPLIDALSRLLVSAYLYPGPDPRNLEDTLTAVAALLDLAPDADEEKP